MVASRADSLRMLAALMRATINQPPAAAARDMPPTIAHLDHDRAILRSAYRFCGSWRIRREQTQDRADGNSSAGPRHGRTIPRKLRTATVTRLRIRLPLRISVRF